MEKNMSKTTADGHAMSTKSEALDGSELSLEELAAVSGGDVSVSFFGHKVTTSDVADAAKWVWNKLF
jgi:hypothetical protein